MTAMMQAMPQTFRSTSPRMFKPDFRESSIIEERDKSGRVVGRFRCGKLLGKGGFGKCYEVVDLDAPPNTPALACKVVDRATLQKSKNLQKLHSEIAIHKRMKHKNIVNFIRTFQDEWFVYMLLEKCSMQTLMEVSKTRSRFSVPETQFIMAQSIAAIQYMHDQFVIHRDLKLGNMMLDDGMNVKIGDFGLAAELQYDGERKRTMCGTPNYIAPEILEGARDGHSYEVDIWSLGVILYTLLVGEPPFQTADVKTTYDRIKRCRFEFPATVSVSEAGKDLVHRILQSRPDRRATLVEIRNHPFFKAPAVPTMAPITLYPEAMRRRLTAEGYGTSAPALGSAKASDVPRDPLRPLWSANQAPAPASSMPSSRPTSQAAGSSAPSSARGSAGAVAYAAPFPTAASTEPAPLSARTRTSSVPAFAGTRRPDSAQAAAVPLPTPTVGGWCAPAAAKLPAAESPRQEKRLRPQVEDDEEKAHLTAMHDKLHKTICGTLEDDEVADELVAPSVWITDYADFSSKYGLAYKLSTGHTGVHFNDSTKMVWEPITGRSEYYARIRETVNGQVVAQDKRESFVMDTFPDALQKKVTLIKYFKSYVARGRTAARGSSSSNVDVYSSPFVKTAPALLSEPHMVSDMVYVKRWISNPDAMIFRLSNKVIQVSFKDNTEVLLSSESKVVTYTDAQGRRRSMLLSSVARESEEIANRLKYTRDTLSKLISNREL